MNPNIIKESLIESQPIPIDIEGTKLILSQMENCICKIFQNEKKGTGFFCKIPFPDKYNLLNVLITNNHILNENDIENNKIIKLIVRDGKQKVIKEIKIDESRKRYTKINDGEGIDIAIIEIKPKIDNIYNFLEIDDETLELECKRKSIYILHYPKDKQLVSYGLMKDIIADKKINHYCNTEEGSSGSPILSLNNYKVFGVHYGGSYKTNIKLNYGTYIKYAINEFNNKYNNEINLIYFPKEEGKFNMFGDKLVGNNENNFGLIKREIKNNLIEDCKLIKGENNIKLIIKNENAIKKIQKKWRNHQFKIYFELVKPQLRLEGENFIKEQYEICDNAGPIRDDSDFNLEGWKKFYPPNDPFFNFNKGFVIPFGIKIEHPNDPNKVSVYEGDINIKNEKHGFGRLTTVKSVFLGVWRNDQFTGWGRETRRSGKVLEGKYINGLVKGKGILKNMKGNIYIGDFSNSKREGKGVLDTHKIHYEGEFKNEKLSGKGRITFKVEGHYYEGDFDNNEINGYGIFTWKNGDSYTGQMINGKMHGKGIYIYNNGDVYEGLYANGKRQGKGKVYNLNDSINNYNEINDLNISGVTFNNTRKNNKIDK